jgi:hypothetical protein
MGFSFLEDIAQTVKYKQASHNALRLTGLAH